MRSCDGCREYRVALRGMRRSFAALTPFGVGPIAFAAKLIGLGGGGGAAASGAAAGGGSAAVAGSGVATATACKVAAVVCTAALATGGAVEVNHKISHDTAPKRAQPAKSAAADRARPAAAAAAVAPSRPVASTVVLDRVVPRPAAAPVKLERHKTAAPAKEKPAVTVAVQDTDAAVVTDEDAAPADPQLETGGVRAPDAPAEAVPPVASVTPGAPGAPIADQAQPTPAPATAQSVTRDAPAAGAVTAPAAPDTPSPGG